MKDPIDVFGRRWGFSVSGDAGSAVAGNETRPSGILSRKGIIMPVWMDILLNVFGYAGFVGVATFNHSREEATPNAEPVS